MHYPVLTCYWREGLAFVPAILQSSCSAMHDDRRSHRPEACE